MKNELSSIFVVSSQKTNGRLSTFQILYLKVQKRIAIWLQSQNFRARSLVVSDLRSETKGSRFESSC